MRAQPIEPPGKIETSEKSFGELFADLGRETTTLVRQEVQLAKAELVVSAKQTGKLGAFVAGGGVLAHIGVLSLVAAAIVALGTAIPYWASALLIGALLVAGGAAMARYGQKKLEGTSVAPRKTIGSVKESALIIKDHAKWNREAH